MRRFSAQYGPGSADVDGSTEGVGMKIGLGTAQFGMDYGISNPDGKTPEPEVKRILQAAAVRGIRIIDTAALYRDSEGVLGNTLPADHDFDIVTKTPRFSKGRITREDLDLLEEAFLRSLVSLKRSSVYGLLLHDAADPLAENGQALVERMEELRDRGLVKKIGVSVYDSRQIDGILERYRIDLVQVSLNVLDQRLLRNGRLAALKYRGIEVHARSAFLQGLLLMEFDRLPPHFSSVKPHLKKYHEFMAREGLTAVEAALGFVLGLDEVDVVVCGVNTCRQLDEICGVAARRDREMFGKFAIDDETILNPSLWRL